jgi:signal peptidase II
VVEAGTDRDASLRPVLVLAGTAVVLYVADQVTKALIVATLPFGERVDVIGSLAQLWHVRNTGAAFSILPGATWLFVPVTLLAIGMVAYFHRTLHDRGPWVQVILGAILAGALGNLTDRIRLGYVIDFVSLGIGDVRFPTFNVADSAVVLGIGALVAYLTFVEQPRSAEAAR